MNVLRARLRALWATPRGKIVIVAAAAGLFGVFVVLRRGGSGGSEPEAAAAAATGETFYGSAGPSAAGAFDSGPVLGDGGTVDPYGGTDSASLWENIAELGGAIDSQQSAIDSILAAGSGAGAAAGAVAQAPAPTAGTGTKPAPVKPVATVKAGFFRSGGHWYFRNAQGSIAAVSAPPAGATRIPTPAGFNPATAAQPNRPAEPARPTPVANPTNPSPTRPPTPAPAATVKAGFFRTANHWYFINSRGNVAKVAKPSQGATIIPTPAGVTLPK